MHVLEYRYRHCNAASGYYYCDDHRRRLIRKRSATVELLVHG